MEEFGTAVEVEEHISNARKNYFDRNFASLHAAATKYHVLYSCLYARQHSRPSKVGRPGPNKWLNPEQEAALWLYIRRCDEIGYSAMPFMVYNAATCILEESRVDPTIPIRPLGHDWVLRFLAANPDIEKCIQKPKDKKRIDVQKREQIEKIFQKIKKVRDEKGILPSDCWNFDETGFRIGCGGKQIVLTLGAREKPKKDRKSLIITSETNRNYLTSIEAISTAGDVIPPMLILKVTQHLFQWYTHTEILGDYLLGVSDTGYSNDELALDWIQHFDNYSCQYQRGTWRLLLFDGFGSHLTKQFVEYCDSRNIIPFSLPSHTSHLLQLLDVTVFQLFKHWHKRMVEIAVRTCHGTSFPLTEGLSTSPHLPRYLSDRSHDLRTVYIARPLWPLLVSFPFYATTVLSPKSYSSPRDSTGCVDFNKVEFLHNVQLIRSNTFKRRTILSA
jgi:hypothetical protein